MRPSSIMKPLIVLLSGALLACTFAPFYLPWFAPIALLPLLLCWRKSSPWQSCLQGLLFGIGFFGVSVSWIYISIHRFGNTNIALSSLITGCFIFILSLYPAFQGYCLARFFKQDSNLKWLLVFPSSWVILEWLRGWLLSGFPWAFLGYSQTNSWLKGFAPIIGVYGISFLLTFSAALLLLICIRYWKTGLLSLLSLILLWLAGLGLTNIHWTTPTDKSLTVSLIQGNIPQHIKWNAENLQSTLDLYMKLTQQQWQSDLIIWPEAAVPLPLPNAQPFIDRLNKLAQARHRALILGIPVQADNGYYYNAAIAIGTSTGEYDKQHLVPFGEYVPFEKWFRGIIGFFNLPMSSFVTNPQTQRWLTVNDIEIAPFICYEIAYPNLVRKSLPKAQLLLTLTDDAWFGRSFASIQHLQIGQMRSLETGRYTLFVANSGITAIITPQGCLSHVIQPYETSVLKGKVIAMKGETPWVFLGPWPFMTLFMLILILCYLRTPRYAS